MMCKASRKSWMDKWELTRFKGGVVIREKGENHACYVHIHT